MFVSRKRKRRWTHKRERKQGIEMVRGLSENGRKQTIVRVLTVLLFKFCWNIFLLFYNIQPESTVKSLVLVSENKSLKIPKEYSEVVNRRIDITKAKRKVQTAINKT